MAGVATLLQLPGGPHACGACLGSALVLRHRLHGTAATARGAGGSGRGAGAGRKGLLSRTTSPACPSDPWRDLQPQQSSPHRVAALDLGPLQLGHCVLRDLRFLSPGEGSPDRAFFVLRSTITY